MTPTEQKKQFAVEMLKFPGEGLRAATAVFGELHPIQSRMQIADLWTHDAEVLSIMDDLLKEHGEDAFLPTKNDTARAIFKRANGPNVDTENYGKLMRLFCEVRGFIDKPKSGNDAGVTNVGNMNVLVVQDKGSDEDWGRTLREQQQRLIGNGAEILQ